MELLQLRYFVHAAESENFSHTAKHFMIPPSAVSQSVRRLEGELGVRLFLRAANRVRLSPEGRVFYDGVKGALASIESACTSISEMSGRIAGELRLFIGTNRRTVMNCIERYRRLYPEVSFRVNHGVLDDPVAYDLIIGDESVMSFDGLESRLLIRERIALAVPRELDLCGEGQLLSDFSSCGFIAMHREASLTRFTVNLCRRFGFEPNIVIQSDDPAYVRKCLELGLGVALVPTYSWRGMFAKDLRLIDIEDGFRDTYVFFSSSAQASLAQLKFIDLLTEAFSDADAVGIDI